MPTSSIALATYNGEMWLEQQLDSFLHQTRMPDQIVISDDGSTDSTWEIVQQFAKTCPAQVITRRNPVRLGYAKNFGQALAACSEDFVFLSDQDDFWFPTKIATIIAAMESSRSAVAIHDLIVVDADLKPQPATMLERDPWHIKGCATALNKSLLKYVLPIPDHRSHDQWIHALASALDERLVVTEPLGFYRVHGSNTSELSANSLLPPTRMQLLVNKLMVPVYEAMKDEKSLVIDIERKRSLILRLQQIGTPLALRAATQILGELDRLERRQRSVTRRAAIKTVRTFIRTERS